MSIAALRAGAALPKPSRWRERLNEWTPRLVLAPSLIASFVYVFVFTFWTLYISLSNSTLLPTYQYVGFKHYSELWANHRWAIAYGNLFFFSGVYVVLALLIGLALAIAIDQRVGGDSARSRSFGAVGATRIQGGFERRVPGDESERHPNHDQRDAGLPDCF